MSCCRSRKGGDVLRVNGCCLRAAIVLRCGCIKCIAFTCHERFGYIRLPLFRENLTTILDTFHLVLLYCRHTHNEKGRQIYERSVWGNEYDFDETRSGNTFMGTSQGCWVWWVSLMATVADRMEFGLFVRDLNWYSKWFLFAMFEVTFSFINGVSTSDIMGYPGAYCKVYRVEWR